MARTKQTARKSSGGKAPRKMMAVKSATQLRQYLTGRQAATYASATPSQQKKTSYINYENIFYSYFFPTSPRSTQTFEPRFMSGTGKHPISGKKEQWLGMSFSSKFDGDGIKVHGRPHLNLSIVLDVSGSMGSPFEQDATHSTKLDVAKNCLQTLTDQLKSSDRFGLVKFNSEAMAHCPMEAWSTVNKTELKKDIEELRAQGLTCLTAAIDCATEMFNEPFEHTHSTSRIIFLTDLCSTVDTANDERKLLSTIKKNAERGIYTTVVGIGMDLNVRLVEEISKTAGAKYCSVDSSHEFQQIMNNEFDYDTTILAFDIKVELQSPDYQLVKGYGSPELNAVKPGKPVLISSEFPSWQNDQGESKGGMMLFKMEQKKGRKSPADEVKVCVSWRDVSGVTHRNIVAVKVNDSFVDVGTRKAALLVHYVDLHNDYVHDCRQNKLKFLEMFQSFRTHFVKELEEMGDKSWSTYNKGDLELVDKIIELEEKPEAPGPSGLGPSVTFNPTLITFVTPGSRSKAARPPPQQRPLSPRKRPAQRRGAKRLTRSKGQQSASFRGGPPSPAAAASTPQTQGKRKQAVGQVGTRRSARIAAQSAPPVRTGNTSQTRKRKANPPQAKDMGPSPAKKRKPASKKTAKSSAVGKRATRKTQK